MTEMKSFYSAVRTGALNKAVCASSFKGLIWADWKTSLKCCFWKYCVTPLMLLLGINAEVCKSTAQNCRYYTVSCLHLSLLCRVQSKLRDSFVISCVSESSEHNIWKMKTDAWRQPTRPIIFILATAPSRRDMFAAPSVAIYSTRPTSTVTYYFTGPIY